MLPTLLDYTCKNGNAIMKVLQQHKTDPSLILTEAFLNLLSAILERQAPRQFAVTGMGSSQSTSRAGSGRESMASIFSAKSSESLYTEKTSVLSPIDTLSELLLDDGDLNDGVSECSGSDVDAQLSLNQQHQNSTMVAFAAIWCFGAYISFR